MEKVQKSILPFANKLVLEILNSYVVTLKKIVGEKPELIKTIPGFLLCPETVVFYLGRTHFGIEYVGPDLIDRLSQQGELISEYHDYAIEECNLIEKIIGFPYDCSVPGSITMPLSSFVEDLILPTNRGAEKLLDLKWNFFAQNALIGFNMPSPSLVPQQFTRIINSFFFDANDSGLVTRRIQWLDLFPLYFDGSDAQVDRFRFNTSIFPKLAERDASYELYLPDDYKYQKLPIINRFIEVWGSSDNSEPTITSFLAQPPNRFILTMRFGAVEIFPEILCEWQSEDRDDIKPDFFVLHPNGYADIVEFKLPLAEQKAVIGRANREAFSAWLNSYIAQTRVYSIYFDDPNNRRWFEAKYGFKVYKPKRWLVVGRRSDFDSDVWKEIISDYKDIDIITYDDLIDGVVVQFYK